MPIYAAYGSNMDPEQMLERCPHSPMAGTGWLHDWRLTFSGGDIGWEGALATVVEEPGSKVVVVLYDVPEEDEKRLDRWEGSELGIHRKIRLRVDVEASGATGRSIEASEATGRSIEASEAAGDNSLEGPVLAWLYVLDAYEGGLPSARYLGVMADAAEKAGAPEQYVHDLRTRPSRNVGPGTFGG